jgi:ribosome biogenesis protein BRX1
LSAAFPLPLLTLVNLSYLSSQIWVRNYQIVEEQASNALEAQKAKKTSGQTAATSLVEIGPRFVLNPIRIFRGPFGGQTLFQNPDFVSPNEIRSEQRRKTNGYQERKEAKDQRQVRKEQIILPEDPLDSVFR